MKIACTCGWIIEDTTDQLRYKAMVRSDMDDDLFWTYIEKDVMQLVAHASQVVGLERSRIAQVAIEDLGLAAVKLERKLYCCESCGRLYLQSRTDPRRYDSFLPETSARNVLDSASNV